MKAFQVVDCRCDGGRIGRTWSEWLFLDRDKAEAKLRSVVEEDNQKELARKDDFCIRERKLAESKGISWWRLWTPDTVEGIVGWCVRCYSRMLYIAEVEID